MSQTRFTDRPRLDPRNVWGLKPDHPAMVENRTLFPSTVVDVTRDAPKRILVSGHNNRKLGKVVTKGQFEGYRLYSLSLEERDTCPLSCGARSFCYGNGMPMARRHRIDSAGVFYERLEKEIAELSKKRGLLVRLHVLGDFPSPAYVRFWEVMLDRYPNLAVFGYTHRLPRHPYLADGDLVGNAIHEVKQAFPHRFRIRWSRDDSALRSVGFADCTFVVEAEPNQTLNIVMCPAQTDKTACCATCAMCWSTVMSGRNIGFYKHGPKGRRRDNVAG